MRPLQLYNMLFPDAAALDAAVDYEGDGPAPKEVLGHAPERAGAPINRMNSLEDSCPRDAAITPGSARRSA
jgi:hypothetical protein